MRIVPLALVLLLFLASACGGAALPAATPAPALTIPPRAEYKHNGKVSEEYDRFDKETVVRLSTPSDAISNLYGGLTVIYAYPGETPARPSTVTIGFVYVNDTWEYLECHSLAFLIDGDETLTTRSDHLGDVMEGGKVSEIVHADISPDDFLRLVHSSKLEAKVCNDDFLLTDAQMASLRDVASRMPSAPPRDTNAAADSRASRGCCTPARSP